MQKVIIIGAGHAAAQLAPSLRKQGWKGEILIIGDEAYIPYQRPPLSKEFMAGKKTDDEILIRPLSAYGQHDISFKLNETVVKLNPLENTLTLSTGESIGYDRLALCTGARTRKIPIPGSELEGVFYLRTIDDVKGIKHMLDAGIKGRAKKSVNTGDSANVVIVGGGYIGLETAAALRKMGVHVTILEMQDRVLARVTAPEVSEFYQRVHAEEGVQIHIDSIVSHIEGEGQVSVVHCKSGERFDADLVIIGVGVVPNVELAEEAGLLVDNGIVVDEFGQTSVSNIFAAGDCTSHPNALLADSLTNGRLRLESVPNAMEQAKTVAASICGQSLPYASYPWFWSDQYDLKLQIAGLSQGFDQVVIRGDHKNSRSFVAWYLKQGKLLAADCVNRPKEFLVAKKLLSRGDIVDPDKLVDESIDPKTFLQ